MADRDFFFLFHFFFDHRFVRFCLAAKQTKEEKGKEKS